MGQEELSTAGAHRYSRRTQCHSGAHAPSPQQQPFPTCWAVPSSSTAARLPPSPAATIRLAPLPLPQSSSQCCGDAACLWLGHCRGFIFDYCVSWPRVRWGRGQEHELVQGAQPSPWPSPAASQQRQSQGSGGLRSADYVAKGKAFPECCKAHNCTGLLLALLLASPSCLSCAGATPLFPNGHTHKR